MPVQYISGINADKQNLRRSTHLGSDLTSSYTILAAAETFDPQACFVYLNGAMLKEGTAGNGGDYVLSGNSTVTFNVALATTDVVEVISYNFTNSILPETMIETDHVITSANASYHSTAVTGASYAYATHTLTKASHGLAIGHVINVSASPTTNSLAVGRFRVKSVSGNDVVLTTVNDVALTYTADSASANINFTAPNVESTSIGVNLFITGDNSTPILPNIDISSSNFHVKGCIGLSVRSESKLLSMNFSIIISNEFGGLIGLVG